MATVPKIIEIFYLYVPEDSKLLMKLEKHLSPLKYLNVMVGWSAAEIRAGMNWKQEIGTHLNSADIILLLISSDFIASHPFNYPGMVNAYRRHHVGDIAMVSIILRPTLWKVIPGLGTLQVLPKNEKPVTSWSNRDEAFLNVALGISEVAQKLVEKAHDRYVAAFIDYLEERQIEKNRTSYTDKLKKEIAENKYNYILDKLKNAQMEIRQEINQLSENGSVIGISSQQSSPQQPTYLMDQNKIGTGEEEESKPVPEREEGAERN